MKQLQLPSAFIQSLQAAPGFEQEAFENVHQSGEQITSIRVNNCKAFDILHSTFNISEVPWNLNGYYLAERPSFTLDPLFHAGAYYVQEASSMFLEQALKQTVDLSRPIKVLDLCAAPGGKSTLIQSLISGESLLVSNEVIKTRVNVLAENIAKWGAANVIVTNNDPKDFQRLPDYFDVIVIDAPCSGSGLFRKDTNAINEWSEQNVLLCSQRQERILADILPSLKRGGILIYSTCSYSEEEDEEIADWLTEQFEVESLRLEIKDDWGIVETKSPASNACGYRFYPDKVKGEGFFIAAFKKPTTNDGESKEWYSRSRSEKLSAKEVEVVQSYLKDPDNFFFIKQKDEVIAMPLHLENDLANIQSALYIKKAGVKLGTIIRNELIPHHELAISSIINRETPSVEVELDIALQYLRKQEIHLETERKGWSLLTYKQLPLGWVKLLPNRVNNYYPKDWRILNK
ncbi:RNA methyltransferase [Ferruginibacter lapsinanis]|uniref:methyltransferase RsmF C-terminal domain-like protein n=1 Tax=Ferruginibacter lapsinanis TaxID=563172 RepID=UPI001E2C2740|nr:RNA methyltransferase [Ferruginibacter lapsinanis]UEG51240.1 RNA methyltransferase [Ferruginibacter lapsinanis]